MNEMWPNVRWRSVAELAAAMSDRALSGKRVILSPDTARMIAMLLDEPARPSSRFRVDLYDEGSCIYQIDGKGEVFRIDAWARSSLVAGAAFEALKAANPTISYSQRRGAWVEGE